MDHDTSAPGDPGQRRCLPLPGPQGAVARSRAFAREAMYAWGWLPATGESQRAAAEDILLMTSELVTNACLHAEGPYELVLLREDPVLRIEVVDATPQPPVLQPVRPPWQPGGHGLRVVDRLAVAWGSEPRGRGKAVWLETVRPGRP